LKARLAQQLSELTFGRWATQSRSSRCKEARSELGGNQSQPSSVASGKVIFGNSGFEAVEAALKTARLATGKAGIIAFEGGYHGLGYGALNATHREHFRGPFRNQLREFGHFLPFPGMTDSDAARSVGTGAHAGLESDRRPRRSASGRGCPLHGDSRGGCPTAAIALAQLETQLRATFRRHRIGAILVEPMQARGGIRIPPTCFLPLLRRVAGEHGALLVLDEIYTGFGRTGTWFACEHSGVVPDVICLGKALTGGFPLSACVGRADLMDAAWPPSSGEAIHTSTFLGHPVGCAMALAQLAELKAKRLVERTAELGTWLAVELARECAETRGQCKLAARCVGLMAGIEFTTPDGKPATELSLTLMKRLLHRGFITLPEGEHGNILSFTPPLTITRAQLQRTLRATFRELSNILVVGAQTP
jgi:4-aminobutyrate aminotransferase-like enzyme